MPASPRADPTREAIEPTQCRVQVADRLVLAGLFWGQCARFPLGEQRLETVLKGMAGSQHQRCPFDVDRHSSIR